MVSEVSLCNRALDLVGGSTINALTEESTAAKLCNRHFADARDELQIMHKWDFCTDIVTLNRLVSVPAAKWAYSYQLDASHIKVWGFANDDSGQIKYQVTADNVLMTDEATAIVEVTKRVTNPSKFEVAYNNCFIYLLASRIAYKIADSRTLQNDMTQQFIKMFDISAGSSSQQGNEGRYNYSEYLAERL